MNIVDLSIKRPIMISMGLVALVLFGILAYFSLPVSLFPNMSVPYVTIQTVYAGASPEVIETQISKKIEDQVSSISGLEKIVSYSMDNASVVLIEFKYGIDENIALQNVKDKVEAISADLPEAAKKPVITKIDVSTAMPVMSIVMEGDMPPTELYEIATNEVSERFAQVDGVGSVTVSGGQEREIRVEMSRSTVYERSIPVLQISGILAAANVDIPGGNFNFDSHDIPVRLKGEFSGIEEIENLDVPTRNGTFKLRQLAEVRDATKTARERTILVDKKRGTRNENAVLLSVVKNPSANTITVVEGVTSQIEDIIRSSGGRLNMKVVKEDATYVRDSVNDTLSNVYLGIFFTGLVLLFFLHDVRSTIIVALAMPFSIISTFLVMKAMGLGLNMLSLMGLSSATGTLVANSVVVLENIFRYKEMGHSRLESASKGTKEVIIAVFASTLTNVAVFIPLGSVSGVMGVFMANFSWTVVISTVFSILVSFTLTPMLASMILPEKVKKEGKVSLSIEAMFKKWEHVYGRMIHALLKKRKRCAIAIAVTVALFGISIGLFTLIPFQLVPETDGGKIQVSVELPQGSDLEKTAEVLSQIEQRIATYEEVESLLTTLGSMGSMDVDVSVAQMDVFLIPKKERKLDNNELAADMTRLLSDIPGVRIRITGISELSVGGATSSDMDLYLKGPDGVVLRDLSAKVLAVMNGVPGITNAASSSKAVKQELVFRPDRKRISDDGITVQQLAMTLRAAVEGFVATTYKEGGEEFDVRVSITGSSLTDIEDIRNIPVVSNAGTFPLSRYADVRFEDGSNKIIRTNKVKTVEITADMLPGYTAGNALAEILEKVEGLGLPEGYSLEQAGTTEMLTNTARDMAIAFAIAVVLVYMVLAATLESLTQPLFIISTVPLSIIGVVFLALGTGSVFNMVGMIGVIMLVGIVVNNAILILDYYNQLRNNGVDTGKALVDACTAKLKPVLMSNIAIILGMLPMAMGIGASGAELRTTMGIVMIGGIISSTILTLFIIPALEFVIDKGKKKRASGKKAHAAVIARETT
jgi:HAE1 family hydrophobic/amphiphilic exporter-1